MRQSRPDLLLQFFQVVPAAAAAHGEGGLRVGAARGPYHCGERRDQVAEQGELQPATYTPFCFV